MFAMNELSTFYKVGILRSEPAVLTVLFSVFSNTFQSFMVLTLVVSNLWYFP